MAIGTSFKQQCPSCEALVPVRHASMVGKRIECPKCKDKFIVKSPATKKAADEDEDETTGKANGKAAPSKPAPGKAPVKKPARSSSAPEDDDEDVEDAKARRKGRAVEDEDD